MDMRWDYGFIEDVDAYIEQRLLLQQELEQLTPIPDEDLAFAADLLAHFGEYWVAAQNAPEEQERLFHLMLERAWVVDDRVAQLCLRPNFQVTAGLESERPTEISVDLSTYQNGSDGARASACIHLIIFAPRHVAPGWFNYSTEIAGVAA
jgi:hypothetical protein